MRRSDFGYRRLSSRCGMRGWRTTCLLQLAADLALTPDIVATIAPDARDHNAHADLIELILSHPACSAGVAGRFATNPHPAIRVRVAHFPELGTPALAVLAIDQNDEVRAAAVEALTWRASDGLDR